MTARVGESDPGGRRESGPDPRRAAPPRRAEESRTALIRALGLPVLLPSLLYSTGEGAVLPIVAVTARQLGGSVPVAALVVALIGIGTLTADLPAGRLAGRIGERNAMLASAVVTIISVGAFLLFPSLGLLAVAMFVSGAALSVWGLSRQTYITEATPVHLRARALALLGATHRIGTLIGPFLGAAIITLASTRATYLFYVVLSGVTVVVLLAVRDPDEARQKAERRDRSPRTTRQLLREYRRLLGTLGLCMLTLSAMRSSRNALLPLWGHHIGITNAQISLLSGLLSGMELLFFYPAGLLMDRRGRSYVAVPCMVLMALAHLLIPLSHGFGLLVAAVVPLGIGNGLGTGINMTLGADVSPDDARPEFLGIWRLVSDTGASGGPAMVSAVSAVAPLAAASVALGVAGLCGAAGLIRFIPRFIRLPRPRTE